MGAIKTKDYLRSGLVYNERERDTLIIHFGNRLTAVDAINARLSELPGSSQPPGAGLGPRRPGMGDGGVEG